MGPTDRPAVARPRALRVRVEAPGPALGPARRASGATRAALGALALAVLASLPAACAPAPHDVSFSERRRELVDAIAAAGVRDSATLAAMRVVPRHAFVPPEMVPFAYVDEALPIGHEQTISQPTIVAIMTEALRPRPGLRVLEVGTGSGYQAAVLAQAGCRVYTIEIIGALADSARGRLERLGYGRVEVRHGDGYLGWPDAAPFEAIMLTAAPERVPQPLLDQLAAGGRLVAPVGPEGGVQQLRLFEKDARSKVSARDLLPVLFVPMRGRAAP